MEDFIVNPRRVGDRLKSFKWRSSRDSARQTRLELVEHVHIVLLSVFEIPDSEDVGIQHSKPIDNVCAKVSLEVFWLVLTLTRVVQCQVGKIANNLLVKDVNLIFNGVLNCCTKDLRKAFKNLGIIRNKCGN